jgi:hypothetical protein
MTGMSPQIQAFVDEVTKLGRAYSFSKNGEYLVLKAGEKDVIPFWSSPTKVQIIQVFFADYDDYKITSMTLKELHDWLPEVEEQDMYIGVNWSGKNLEGYDIAPRQLQKLIPYEPARKAAPKGR